MCSIARQLIIVANAVLVVVQDRPRGRTRRIFTAIVLSLGSFVVGGYLALSYAPPFLTPLILGPIPTNEDSLKWEAPDELTREINEHIKNCATAQELRNNPDWIESRPHVKIPAEIRQHNLTAGTLAGPDMVPAPPLLFNRKDGAAMFCIFYVGNKLSGHPGVVHGGFLATMLDEGLARCAFPVLPNKVGVTASLNINYRKPTMAGQYLILVAQTTKAEGRKAWSNGFIATLEDYENAPEGTRCKPLVEAEALFIEPKYAKVRVWECLRRKATLTPHTVLEELVPTKYIALPIHEVDFDLKKHDLHEDEEAHFYG